MAYTVKIEYTPLIADAERVVANICPLFTPDNAYCDTEAYEGSVYDTNVKGNGNVAVEEPFASTAIPFGSPLAQFKLAIVGEDNAVEFDVDGYEEAFYYKTIGTQLADQGFKVTVEKKTA